MPSNDIFHRYETHNKNCQKYLNIPMHKIIVVYLVRSTMSYIQIKNTIKRKKNVSYVYKSIEKWHIEQLLKAHFIIHVVYKLYAWLVFCDCVILFYNVSGVSWLWFYNSSSVSS